MAQVAEVLPVELGSDQAKTDRDDIARRLRQDFAADLLVQYATILRQRYDVTVYDKVIDSLL